MSADPESRPAVAVLAFSITTNFTFKPCLSKKPSSLTIFAGRVAKLFEARAMVTVFVSCA
jgi:hypothetical protein